MANSKASFLFYSCLCDKSKMLQRKTLDNFARFFAAVALKLNKMLVG